MTTVEHPAELTAAQRAALDHVRARAARHHEEALRRLGPGIDVVALTAGAAHARVTLNFHPDRLLRDGRTVAQSLALDGVYRNQFETGLSNGGRSAFPGGDRDIWEERLFGRAYHTPAVPPAQRPLYGALNPHNYSDGASPRFGSCHIRLRAEVSHRCTFTVGDSHLGPADVGTLDAFACVLAGIVERARATGVMLGAAGVDPVELLATLGGRVVGADPTAAPGRCLDDYVEAQVHGGVVLARDAEAVVLDPSLRDTPAGEALVRLGASAGIAVEWHCGFELRVDEFDAEYRGPHVPPLAAAVARGYAGPRGVVDAATVGRAAASAVRRPEAWRRFGTAEQMLQYVKHLWHTLVYCGRPADRAGASPIR